MANDLSIDTFQNNKEKTKIMTNLVIAVVLVVIGATFSTSGGAAAILGGAAIIGGLYFGYMAYEVLVDPKNERRCKEGYFEQIFTDMRVPQAWIDGDVSVDIDYDIDAKSAVSKAQFDGYGGVFLVSNTAPESTGGLFDAYYIPGNAKAILTKKSTITNTNKNLDNENRTVAKFLYIRAPAKTGNRVLAKEEGLTKDVLSSQSPMPLDVCKPEV